MTVNSAGAFRKIYNSDLNKECKPSPVAGAERWQEQKTPGVVIQCSYLVCTVQDNFSLIFFSYIMLNLSKANCYLELRKHFVSLLRGQQKLYKKLIHPVFVLASEMLFPTKIRENERLIFERKILRRIFGHVREGDNRRRRKDKELNELFGRTKSYR